MLNSCIGGRGYHDIPAEGPLPGPRYLEFYRETQVATLHFPAGRYSLHAEDDAGYYYAAPRPVLEHTSIGPRPYEGGLYVAKREPRKLRGYVYWGGVLTHVGDLSRVRHEFSGETAPASEPSLSRGEPE